MKFNKILILGITGILGKNIYLAASNFYKIIGVGRKKPNWYKSKDTFLRLNLDPNNLNMFLNLIDDNTLFINLINLSKQNISLDKLITKNICEKIIKKKGCGLIYASSIRIYGNKNKIVDESSECKIHKDDQYAKLKNYNEEQINDICSKKVKYVICRFGSIFSNETQNKIPQKLNFFSRVISKGKNPHLISAQNASHAILQLINKFSKLKHNVYNITQELEDFNNYLFLSDIIHKKTKVTKKKYVANNITIFFLSLFRSYNNPISLPYIKISEKNLREENISYPESLMESLLKNIRS